MAQRLPTITASTRGCHIEGTLLWLDELAAPEICLLSQQPHQRIRPWGARLVMSEELAKVLAVQSVVVRRRRPMACPFEHPFLLGAYELEWLPAGSAFGAASVRIRGDDWSILYAPHALPTAAPLTARAVIKPSDMLIVAASSPNLDFKVQDRDDLLAQLVERCVAFQHKHQFYPIICCDALGCAQELIRYFGSHGLKLGLSREIYRYTKLYRAAQIELGGTWTTFQRKYFRHKVLLVSPQYLQHIVLTPSFRRSVLCVTGKLHRYYQYQRDPRFEAVYYLSHEPTLADLHETVMAVKPQQVVLAGPYIRGYATALAAHGAKLVAAYPNQQPSLLDLASAP